MENRPITWRSRTAPACEAAARTNKPVLFYFYADWDGLSRTWEREHFSDVRVRAIVNERYVPLRIDRTNTYMNDPAPQDEEAIVEEARARFRPHGSKYGTLFVIAPDCTTRTADLSDVRTPEQMLRGLEDALRH